MAFNVETFKSNLPLGGVRPTLFDVTITNPIDPVEDAVMVFRVQAASLPPSNLGLIEVPYFGRAIKLAGDRTFDPWTTTVLEDEDFAVRQTLEEWSNAINSMEGNIRATASDNLTYKSTALVQQYSKSGTVIRAYQLNGIFPAVVGEIGLGWADYNQLETYTVTWQYDWWSIAGGTTGTLAV